MDSKDFKVEDYFKIANYGQERQVKPTQGEVALFLALCDMVPDIEPPLTRKAAGYVTVNYRGWDFARLKWSPKAIWIMFPNVESKQVKHYLEEPTNVRQFSELVEESRKTIEKLT